MAEPLLLLNPGMAAVRCAKRLSTPCGKRILRAQCRQYRTTRGIATAAAVQEPVVHFSSPPIEPLPRQTERHRKDDLKHAKPFSDFLTDTFNRQHDYLRISITERCNLRCLYCMPEEGVPLSPASHLLTTPEIIYLSALFVSQGVTKIRLTGGEPTVRSDILPLMRNIGALRSRGLKELALTTNGISLHRKLDAMVEAGLTGVNLSLDTLDPFQFQIMTRRRGFEAVMKSVERILEMNKLGAGVKLKINCVVMRGLNEREILPFVEMTREKEVEVRFIEYMPFDGNRWSQGKMLPYREMLEIIRGKYPGLRRVTGHKNDTSKTYEIPGFTGRLGFITSMTHNFCGSCNRLRITSDGNLKVCLFGNAEVSLRDLLRKDNGGLPMDEQAFEAVKQVEMDRRQGLLGETPLGFSERERELLEVIGMAVKRKKEKHAGMGALENMKNRPMILIGGIASPSSPWTRISTSLLSTLRLPTTPSLTLHAHFSTTPRAAKPSPKTAWATPLRSSLEQRSASTDNPPTQTPSQQLAAKAEDARRGQRNERLVRRTNNPAPPWGGRGQEWKKVAGMGWERKKAKLQAKLAQRREGREWRWESIGGVTGVGDSREGGAGKGESKREEYARKAAERRERRAERRRRGGEAGMVAADVAAKGEMEGGDQETGEEGVLWEDGVTPEKEELKEETPSPDPPARLTRQQRLRARAAGGGRRMAEKTDVFDTQGVREPGLDVLMKKIESREAAGPIGKMMEMEAEMDAEMEERNKRRMTVLEAWEREMEADESEPDMLVGENSKEPALTVERRTASEEVLRDATKPKILADGAISEAKKEWFRLQISKREGQVRELENQISSVEKYVSLMEEVAAAFRLQNVRRQVLDLAEKVWDNHAAIRGMKGQLGAIMLPVRARQEIPSMEEKVEEGEEILRGLEEEVMRAGVLVRALRAGLVKLTQATPVAHTTTTTEVHDTANKPRPVASVAEIDEIPPGVTKYEEPSCAIRRLKTKERKSGRGIRGNKVRKLLHDYNYGRVLDTFRETHGGRSGTKQTSSRQTQEDPNSVKSEPDNPEASRRTKRPFHYGSKLDQLASQVEPVDAKQERVKSAQRQYSMMDRTKPPDNPPKRPAEDELIEHVRKLGKPIKITRYKLGRPRKGGVSTLLDAKDKISGGNPLVRFHLNVPRRRLFHTSARRFDEHRTPSSSSSTVTTSTASSDDHTSSSSSVPSPPDQLTPTPHLTHLTPGGTAHMVSITNKSTTHRVAIAVGEVLFSNPDPYRLIAANALKKGDVLAVARIAGIMAAKATPTLIPLCHPIQITKVAVDVWLDERLGERAEAGKAAGGPKPFGGVKIEARVECQGQTGVEMEALTAVSVAGLTVFDMCKAVDRGMVIGGVRVVSKRGGKSGDWGDGRRIEGVSAEGGDGKKEGQE
ncbi:hypothetical protein H2201_002628 [Coniosporium apollinis]|uniref:Radical SAM core domain-containing protein n=1 Tax=Coniosporium apollinis TaxID=61459 RepID=A0ABQ9NXJ7_9PEZI|nr:hypothetical protein H2201_002628 [Coniosporium apollinis]